MLSGFEFLLVAAVALLYVLIRLAPRAMAGRHAWLTPPELQRSLREPPVPLVIDVRSPREFASDPGHLPGSVNIPLERLNAWIESERPLHVAGGRAVVAVCRSDARAALAVRRLRRAGFRDARVLGGGVAGWADAGLPIERGTA